MQNQTENRQLNPSKGNILDSSDFYAFFFVVINEFQVLSVGPIVYCFGRNWRFTGLRLANLHVFFP